MKEQIYNEIKVTISEDEANDMIERVARFIAERHLAPAGILFIESVRPLHGIGSQFLYFVLPFAEIIFDSAKYQRFALMIGKEEYLKRLVDRIDELDEEINRERRKNARLMRTRRRNQIRQFFTKLFNRNKI
ncbi:MAG: hypothetical protein CVU48_05005 [Candidatus Cloacimonetes bacterium HGW-Cloacimonetes-1]|jgi:hypothetical protein|nr:MAG: hypothetical protein CVU48_05005 [Candidatus Cloacimonetes bacterium HGW-Cloacimonetes-1]